MSSARFNHGSAVFRCKTCGSTVEAGRWEDAPVCDGHGSMSWVADL